jgi:hypothetical protein
MFKKKYILFFILFLLGVFLFTSCLPKPPVTEGILKGRVMVPEGSAQAKQLTGQALPDATVNIIDLPTGEIIATTTTDANGYYQVFVPAGGPYLLQAVKNGVKVQQFTPQVEAGIEYDLGIADCSTTAVALIAQAMMAAEDYPNNPADINLADIEADPDFNDVMSIVCSIIETGGDPTVSALVQQKIEDFLHPPTPTPTAAVINIAAIPGVTAPVTGATPVTTITETVQYTGTVTWAPADNPFAGATIYTATITLTAKAGFTLTGVAANFFTVAGTSSLATNPINSGVVTAVFPATAAVIDIAAIPGVTAPVTGATPVTTITETAQYTGTVTWAPADNPFQGSIVYTATITLTAKAGFTLTGVAANFFTVAGATATNLINSGVVTAVFLVVGDTYGGGIVAYILQSGDTGYDAKVQHGLIAATADQSAGIAWSNITNILVGTGTAIGTGQANTTAIVGQNGCTSGAAKLCKDLIEGGYTDWFLPSRDELNALYFNRFEIGNFYQYPYWSSSEFNSASTAICQDFDDGTQFEDFKDSNWYVRAVRKF